MKEEQRTVLTKEGLQKGMLSALKFDMRLLAVLSVIGCMVLGGLTWWACASLPSGIVVLICLALVDVFLLYQAIKNARRIAHQWQYAKAGEFIVVEDKLVGVDKDQGSRYHSNHDMLYVESYGSHPHTAGESRRAYPGDMFYMVVFKDRAQTLWTFYPVQMYVYQQTQESE